MANTKLYQVLYEIANAIKTVDGGQDMTPLEMASRISFLTTQYGAAFLSEDGRYVLTKYVLNYDDNVIAPLKQDVFGDTFGRWDGDKTKSAVSFLKGWSRKRRPDVADINYFPGDSIPNIQQFVSFFACGRSISYKNMESGGSNLFSSGSGGCIAGGYCIDEKDNKAYINVVYQIYQQWTVGGAIYGINFPSPSDNATKNLTVNYSRSDARGSWWLQKHGNGWGIYAANSLQIPAGTIVELTAEYDISG